MQGIDRNNKKMKNEVVSKSIAVPSHVISDEVFEIMILDDMKYPQLVKMLWEQQQKNFSNPTSKITKLRDYKNAIKPCVVFNSAVIDELLHKTLNLIGCQKFVYLLFNEIKIQED